MRNTANQSRSAAERSKPKIHRETIARLGSLEFEEENMGCVSGKNCSTASKKQDDNCK